MIDLPHLLISDQNRCPKVVIFDRDSTIIEDFGYMYRLSDIQFLPGALQAIAFTKKIGAVTAIATNQSGVGRGFLTIEQLDSFHRGLIKMIEHETGVRISVIASCIHLPEDQCYCRKPKPGLLLTISELIQASDGRSLFLGDAQSDLSAGLAAGMSAQIASGPDLLRNILKWDAET